MEKKLGDCLVDGTYLYRIFIDPYDGLYRPVYSPPFFSVCGINLLITKINIKFLDKRLESKIPLGQHLKDEVYERRPRI